MAGVDKKLAAKEKKSEEIKEKYLKRKAKQEKQHVRSKTIELSSSCTSLDEEPGTSEADASSGVITFLVCFFLFLGDPATASLVPGS